MNTPVFYILQCIFILLYIMDFILWHRIIKSDSVQVMPKSKAFRFIALYVFGVVAAVAAGAFITDFPAKFRLTLIATMIAPIIIFHVKSLILNASLRKSGNNKSDSKTIIKRSFYIQLCSVLIYMVCIPMCMLYLGQ